MLNGTPGADLICGQFGNDAINGLGGNDTLYGDACAKKAGIAQALKDGNDRLNGGAGNDTINAANGVKETIDCGAGKKPTTDRGIQAKDPGARRAPGSRRRIHAAGSRSPGFRVS